MKKIIIIILALFIITGCSINNSNETNYKENTINYNLYINDYYMENIDFYLPENAYEIADKNDQVEYDLIEYILLKDNFSRPIHNNNKTFYQKTINKLDSAIKVNLRFNYLEEDFINSNYINTCFENKDINSTDDYFEIHLSGGFYCLQDKELTVQVTSNYVEEETNGEKVNNSFKWVINNDNSNNVNIYYKLYRDKSKMINSYDNVPKVSNSSNNNILIIEFIVIVSILIIGSILYFIIIKKK